MLLIVALYGHMCFFLLLMLDFDVESVRLSVCCSYEVSNTIWPRIVNQYHTVTGAHLLSLSELHVCRQINARFGIFLCNFSGLRFVQMRSLRHHYHSAFETRLGKYLEII